MRAFPFAAVPNNERMFTVTFASIHRCRSGQNIGEGWVMSLSNKVNRNFAASSACIADPFRHDVCVFVPSIETRLTLVKLHFCSVWPKYW